MITILFFAQLQEEIGPSLRFEGPPCTIQELRNHIGSLYPHASITSAMSAINEEFASEQELVKEDDVVAFLPPVSGG